MKKILLIMVVLLMLTGCGKKEDLSNNNDNSNESVNSNIKITKVYANSDTVLMLTDTGDLYAYGDYYGHNKVLDKPIVIASSVKKLIYTDFSINYIDYSDNLYSIGYGTNRENYQTFTLISNGVLDAAIQNNYCALYLKNDGVYRIGQYPEYCGWDISPLLSEEKYDIENVKSVFMGDYYSGYISASNDLFLLKAVHKNIISDYVLFMSNVKQVSLNYILTNDNIVYQYHFEVDDSRNVINQVATNGQVVFNYGYISSGTLHTGLKDYSDAKDYIVGDTFKDVYINNKDKIVLSNGEGSTEIDLSINSMKKILEFLN